MAEITSPPRRRFSLRALLLLVTVFGCWLGYQVNWIRERNDFLGRHPLANRYVMSRTARAAPGYLWLFGEHGRAMLFVSHPDDAEQAKRLFPEANVSCPASSATETVRL
jgi:hypothetical protein